MSPSSLEAPIVETRVVAPAVLRTDDVYRMTYKDRSRIDTIHFHMSFAPGEDNKYDELTPEKRQEMISRDRLQAAVTRAKRYCDNMRYRFIFCELFLVNLDERERIAAQSY
jgi:hypothetical protein